jgi:hypothetical protein
MCAMRYKYFYVKYRVSKSALLFLVYERFLDNGSVQAVYKDPKSWRQSRLR